MPPEFMYCSALSSHGLEDAVSFDGVFDKSKLPLSWGASIDWLFITKIPYEAYESAILGHPIDEFCVATRWGLATQGKRWYHDQQPEESYYPFLPGRLAAYKVAESGHLGEPLVLCFSEDALSSHHRLRQAITPSTVRLKTVLRLTTHKVFSESLQRSWYEDVSSNYW